MIDYLKRNKYILYITVLMVFFFTYLDCRSEKKAAFDAKIANESAKATIKTHDLIIENQKETIKGYVEALKAKDKQIEKVDKKSNYLQNKNILLLKRINKYKIKDPKTLHTIKKCQKEYILLSHRFEDCKKSLRIYASEKNALLSKISIMENKIIDYKGMITAYKINETNYYQIVLSYQILTNKLNKIIKKKKSRLLPGIGIGGFLLLGFILLK